MENIAMIGLGNIGYPIALNLIKANNKLKIAKYKNSESIAKLAQEGAIVCSSFNEAIESSDFLVLALPNAENIKEILFNNKPNLKEGLVIFDLSTIDLKASLEIGLKLKEQNIIYIDSPVSGGVVGAQKGELTLMVGSTDEEFELLKRVLKPVGKKIIHCGKQGMGLVAKLANNLIVATQQVIIGEALAMAKKTEIELETLLEVLNNSTCQSSTLQRKTPNYISDHYIPTFSLELMDKDLKAVIDTANYLNAETPITDKIKTIFEKAKEKYSQLDSSAVVKYYEKE
jgi:3-hydroxyisobutyrate dehydrogenase-like beta-hydroxyacid dehydrogenase